MTTVAYIDRLGGTKSRTLVKISKELWAWCLKRGIALQAQHLPGKQNLSAYFMSRHLRDRTDWILNPALFRFINQLWGCDQILASIGQILQLVSGSRGRGNRCLFLRLEEFASLCSSSLVSGLVKTLCQGATLVLVTPCWPTQAWFPHILRTLTDHLPLLPDPLKSQVVLPSPNCDCPVLVRPPRLVTWNVSGSNSEQKRFQRELSASSSLHGGTRPIPHTTLHGVNGNIGVLPKIPIPFWQILPTFSSS